MATIDPLMLEAEIKIRIDDAIAERLRHRLQELGASCAVPLEQRDVYFTHPSRDFAQTDEALRLRSDARGLRITYKGPNLDPPRKTREEIEFPIDTAMETASTLFERLGFSPLAQVAKTRTEFVLPGPPAALVSLDEVEGLGTFCELEVEAETVGDGRRALDELAATLAVSAQTPIPQSYLELLLRKRVS